MSAVLTRLRSSSLATRETQRPAPGLYAAQAVVAIDGRPDSAGFTALLGAFRNSGGTARGGDLARLLTAHQRGGCASLARLIVAGEVFGFKWREALWIPMFQFDSRDLTARRAVRQILAELAPDFDGWSLAAWFANGNTWLDGQRPVDLLGRDLPPVLNAARADRFIAAG